MRARSLKPGFFHNEDLTELPFEYRLLFAGLWTMADREGRLEDRPKKIKLTIFPGDNVDCEAGLRALHDHDFIIRYEHGKNRYIQVKNWSKHQSPHVKEAASIIPAYEEHQTSTVQAPDKNGADTSVAALTPSSLTPDSGLLTPHSPSLRSGSVELKLDGGPVGRVFEHWRSEYRHPKASLDPKRRKAIQRALEAYDEATVCAAIAGYKLSPHHMGQNDQRAVYDDISLFLRDAEHIERGLNFARAPPARVQSPVEAARARLQERMNGNGRVVSEQSGGSNDSGVGPAVGALR